LYFQVMTQINSHFAWTDCRATLALLDKIPKALGATSTATTLEGRDRAVERHQVAREIAAAVDVDKVGQHHGGNGRLRSGPLLLSLARLQAVQIIRGALRMRGGTEYRPLVVLQYGDPRRNVGGVTVSNEFNGNGSRSGR
jgi:hypothetical protein